MTNYFERIADGYENDIAALVHNCNAIRRRLRNSADIGQEVEELYLSFLHRYLPKTCDAFRGGQIFDITGETSAQTDILVSSINNPRFSISERGHGVAPLEGTIAAIEVKTKLDKCGLEKSLKAFSKIPPMPDLEKQLPAGLRNSEPVLNNWCDSPFKAIIAFEGMEKEDAHREVSEFYKDNPHIPKNRQVNMIHMLKQYYVKRLEPDDQIKNPDGTSASRPPDGEFQWFSHELVDALAVSVLFGHIYDFAPVVSLALHNQGRRYINEIAKVAIATGEKSRKE